MEENAALKYFSQISFVSPDDAPDDPPDDDPEDEAKPVAAPEFAMM